MKEATKKKMTELRELLEARWLTAGQIAERLGCNKLTAYRRVAAMCKAGYSVREKPVRTGKRGPLAMAFTTRSIR